jgi:hypothetical protein
MNDPSDKPLNTLDIFLQAAVMLDLVWKDEEESGQLMDDYPFQPIAFADVVPGIARWLETSRGCRADADSFRLAEASPVLLKAAREAHDLLSRIQAVYDEKDDEIMAPPWPEIDALDLAIQRTER